MVSHANPDTFVSVMPFFSIPDGNMAKVEEGIKIFLDKMSPEAEPKCLFYGFTMAEDKKSALCREAYEDAEGVLNHLQRVDAELKAFTAEGCAKLDRLEIHGPASELEKLKEPLKGVNPVYFVTQAGGFMRK